MKMMTNKYLFKLAILKMRRKINMSKIINWIKAHKKITIFILCSTIFLPIIVLHLLFKIRTNCYWVQADWQSGDVLGYFGDVLSFIGTIILGYIAILQAEKANQLSNELLKIEKSRIKPCLDISTQLYKIYLDEDMYNKLEEIKTDNMSALKMDLLYTSNPRGVYTTSSALIELDVSNSGHSDIRRMYVKNPYFYLAVSDPINPECDKIVMFMSDTSLKINEKKKLFIHVKWEVTEENEQYSNWYIENIDKLRPHIELEFILETTEGNQYIEKLSCGSSWDISMKNINNIATREIGITEINVEEKTS